MSMSATDAGAETKFPGPLQVVSGDFLLSKLLGIPRSPQDLAHPEQTTMSPICVMAAPHQMSIPSC